MDLLGEISKSMKAAGMSRRQNIALFFDGEEIIAEMFDPSVLIHPCADPSRLASVLNSTTEKVPEGESAALFFRIGGIPILGHEAVKDPDEVIVICDGQAQKFRYK